MPTVIDLICEGLKGFSKEPPVTQRQKGYLDMLLLVGSADAHVRAIPEFQSCLDMVSEARRTCIMHTVAELRV